MLHATSLQTNIAYVICLISLISSLFEAYLKLKSPTSSSTLIELICSLCFRTVDIFVTKLENVNFTKGIGIKRRTQLTTL